MQFVLFRKKFRNIEEEALESHAFIIGLVFLLRGSLGILCLDILLWLET